MNEELEEYLTPRHCLSLNANNAIIENHQAVTDSFEWVVKKYTNGHIYQSCAFSLENAQSGEFTLELHPNSVLRGGTDLCMYIIKPFISLTLPIIHVTLSDVHTNTMYFSSGRHKLSPHSRRIRFFNTFVDQHAAVLKCFVHVTTTTADNINDITHNLNSMNLNFS